MDNVLDYWEPLPVEPPLYSATAPWTGRPVYDQHSSSVQENVPPAYSSTVYKLGVFQRKMEWISPYEMAQLRHWDCCLVELNNTQLNIYRCPLALDDPLLQKVKVQSSYSSQNSYSLLHPYHHQHLSMKNKNRLSGFTMLEHPPYNEANFKSNFTTKTDLMALKTFKSLHLLDSTNVIRSYSLQYGKVGLAIDYKKKHFVLRFRLESEQFLLEFPCSEAIIEWYNAIILGIDNALDINRRELPNYRSVPGRRRRRLRHKHGRFGDGILKSHNRDVPRTNSVESMIKRGSSSNNSSSEGISFMGKLFGGLKLKKDRRKSSTSSNSNVRGRGDSGVSVEDVRKALKTLSVIDNNATEDEEIEVDDDDEDDDDDEEDYDDAEEGGRYSENDYGLNRDLSYIEEENTIEANNNNDNNNNNKLRNSVSSRSTGGSSKSEFHRKNSITPNTSAEIVSKSPRVEPIRSNEFYITKYKLCDSSTYSFRAQRKILRDSMRCIPPLIENDKWTNKFIVLDSIDNKYHPQHFTAVIQHFKCQEILIRIPTAGPGYVHKFQRKLQEWVVTPSGLIPCVNITEYGRDTF